MTKSFGSDNHAGAHQAVLRMLSAVNAGDAHGYGEDPWTRQVSQDLCTRFGAADAYFVFNGTGANIVGLSLLLRPFEAVICAESAHLNIDECGAPERLLASKLLPVDTPDGKLTPDLVATRLGGRADEHRAQPRARLHHPGHRTRHLLLAGRTGRAGRVLPGRAVAAVHRRRPAGQRGCLPGLPAGRSGRTRGRAQLRRNEERRDSAPKRSS